MRGVLHNTKDRIRASIYGLLVGDALGCPVEGCRPEEIVEQFGRITKMESPKEKEYRPKGLHSDDGQQAIALCDALLRNDNGVPEEFARILLELYRAPLPVSAKLSFFFGLHRGHGKNFRATVKALDKGARVTECGQPSSGNGSAMLIAPLAIYFRDAEEEAFLSALIPLVKVKTYEVRGIAAAAAVAVIVRHFINHGDSCTSQNRSDFVAFVRKVEVQVSTSDEVNRHVFSAALEAMFNDVEKGIPRPQLLDFIGERASASADFPVYPTLGYSVASVVTSIYFGLFSTDFGSAIEDVIALGGDADTTAAMVGAIAGARFGFSAIPAVWYDELHANGAFDDRVDGLWTRNTGWQPERELVDLETEWCKLYASPESLLRFQKKQAEREERREAKRQEKQKRVEVPSKKSPVIIENNQIDGTWLMNTYGLPGGPWLGKVLPEIARRHKSGELTSLKEIDEIVVNLQK